MAEVILTPPRADEFEVSFFGPGYGECIVVHLGAGEWLINDSCIDQTGRPAGLSYLEKLGVEVAEQVKVVIASHWHDDHVRGLGEVVAQCRQARFVCSGALGSEIFLQLVAVVERDPTSLKSGASEFRRIIDTLNARSGDHLCLAGADQLVWRNSTATVRVHSLSPSTASLTASYAEIAMLVDEVAQDRIRVAAHSPNAASVVVWVDLAGSRVLLGGDLENHTDKRRGWEAVLRPDTRPEGRAQIYKVAHHGSANAHNDEIWHRLLDADSTAVITPWRRGGNQLPQPEIFKKVAALSSRTFLTSRDVSSQLRRSRLVTDQLARATRSIRRLDLPVGQVQMRKGTAEDEWCVNASSEVAAHYRRSTVSA